MAWYFNRGRGNLSLSLTEGRSVSFPGNSWIELTGKDQTCPSVLRALRKGLLKRSETPPKTPSEEAPAPVEIPPRARPATPVRGPGKKTSTASSAVEKTEEVKTPATGDEATATAADAPKPSTAGKSKKTHRFGE